MGLPCFIVLSSLAASLPGTVQSKTFLNESLKESMEEQTDAPRAHSAVAHAAACLVRWEIIKATVAELVGKAEGWSL